MTLVCLTTHDENIYNLEHLLEVDPFKDAKINFTNYISKYNKEKTEPKQRIVNLPDGTKLLTNSCVYKHRSMGEAKAVVQTPCTYLKKNQGVKWRRNKWHVCVKTVGLPPVPRRNPNYVPSQPKYKEEKGKALDPSRVHCPLKRYFRNHQHR